MSASWGWTPTRPEGIWRHGCKWAHPLTAAAPWITLALLLATFALVQGRLAAASGVVFDLPARAGEEAVVPDMAAVVMPVVREGVAGSETIVFFDDARYSFSDEASREALRERLGERAAADKSGELLVLADVRVPSGDLLRLAGIAREAGIVHVEIAERRE